MALIEFTPPKVSVSDCLKQGRQIHSGCQNRMKEHYILKQNLNFKNKKLWIPEKSRDFLSDLHLDYYIPSDLLSNRNWMLF